MRTCGQIPRHRHRCVENIYEWADYNGSLTWRHSSQCLYSIQGFENCENGTSIRLMTIYAAQHNPYSNDVDDGSIIEGVYERRVWSNPVT